MKIAIVAIVPAMLGLVGARPAVAQFPSAACELTASVHYTPALTGTDQTRTFRVEDAVENCVHSINGYPYGASMPNGIRSVGNVWTDPETGYQWQEPPGTATGNCTSNTLTGTYIIRWDSSPPGWVTVVEETTTSTTWGIRADGRVIPSVTLTAVDRQAGQPETLTVETTVFTSDYATSSTQFSQINAADPLECTSSGLPTASRRGLYLLAEDVQTE